MYLSQQLPHKTNNKATLTYVLPIKKIFDWYLKYGNFPPNFDLLQRSNVNSHIFIFLDMHAIYLSCVTLMTYVPVLGYE